MGDDDVWRQISSIMEILKVPAENAVRTNARLIVLRKAVASLHDDPAIADAHILQLERDAETDALSAPDLAQSDAILRLMKAGKNLDSHDA